MEKVTLADLMALADVINAKVEALKRRPDISGLATINEVTLAGKEQEREWSSE